MFQVANTKCDISTCDIYLPVISKDDFFQCQSFISYCLLTAALMYLGARLTYVSTKKKCNIATIYILNSICFGFQCVPSCVHLAEMKLSLMAHKKACSTWASTSSIMRCYLRTCDTLCFKGMCAVLSSKHIYMQCITIFFYNQIYLFLYKFLYLCLLIA